jgi:quercetin dioxygenase-like cupin family protein
MKVSKLSDMEKGWFVGDFFPTLVKTTDVEVAVKSYSKGDYEERHYHKMAKEITVIISGRVKMNNKEYVAGEIIVIDPGEDTDFEALEDVVNVVVKLPGSKDDKYIGKANT